MEAWARWAVPNASFTNSVALPRRAFRADGGGNEFHFLAEQFGKAGGNGLQGKSGIGFVLGTAQMGGEDKAGALVQQELDGGEGGHDAGVIGNFPILEGDVEIHAHQDFLSLGIKVT